MLTALAKAGWSGEAAAIDTTYVKARRSAQGGNVWPAPSATYGPPRPQRMARPVRNVWPAPSARVLPTNLISLRQRIRPKGTIILAMMEIRASEVS